MNKASLTPRRHFSTCISTCISILTCKVFLSSSMTSPPEGVHILDRVLMCTCMHVHVHVNTRQANQ